MNVSSCRSLFTALAAAGCIINLPGQTPRIDSVEPAQGPIAGGTAVTIKGANFSGATLRVDDAVVTPSAVSNNELRFTSASHANGFALIKVATTTGVTYGEFLYVPPKLEELPPGFITTVAGIGLYSGFYRPANQAEIRTQGSPAFDQKGNLYIVEPGNERITRVRPDGILEPFAGTGDFSDTLVGIGGPADKAILGFPSGITFDRANNAYITSRAHHMVVRVDGSTGILTVVAGTGKSGFSGDGGPAVQAQLFSPTHITGDGNGTIYFFDFNDVAAAARIRKVTPDGKISTIAGTDTPGFSGDGGPAVAAQFNLGFADAGSLALDPQGNLYVTDVVNRRVRRIDASTGIITTVFTSDQSDIPFTGIATDSAGNVYFESRLKLVKLSPSGQVLASYGSGKSPGASADGALIADAYLAGVDGLVIDAAGNIVYSQFDLRRIQRLNLATGRVETLAGTFPSFRGETGPAIAARLENREGDVAAFANGDLLIADFAHYMLRRIDRAGIISTYALGGQRAVISGASNSQVFVAAASVKLDGAGNAVLADSLNVFRVDPQGVVQIAAGLIRKTGFSGDGGPALNALTCQPWDVTRDIAGNLFIADTNNNRIRRVDALTGIITTVAGSGAVNGFEHYREGSSGGDGGLATQAHLDTPLGVAVSPDGTLFIADFASPGPGRIRKVDRNGIITTFATVDGVHTKLVFDQAGNLYGILGGALLRYDRNGNVTKICGSRTSEGFAGDGGPADAARMQADFLAEGVAIDASGNIFFNDGNNRRVRAIRLGATFAPLTVGAPTTLTVLAGQNPTFSLTNVPSGSVTYSWQKNGAPISGATSASYTINAAQASDAGTYTLTVTSLTGPTTAASVALTVNPVPLPSRLANLSILTDLTSPTDNFTMGTVIGPAGASGAMPLLARAAGPALTTIGVGGVLPDPNLEFFSDSTKTAENDNWGGSTTLANAFAQVGAFPYAAASSKDAALFNPAVAPGSYSVRVTGVGGATGRVIAELYDSIPGETRTLASPRLINVSVLKQIGGGFTVGFVVGGTLSRTVLVRALGPGLAAVGVTTGTVADPKIALFNGSTQIGSNDNWGGGTALTAAFTQVGAFQIPAASKDAALLAALGPANYSVQVSGPAGAAGLVLVEVYEIP